jgi:hypothetical protein
MGNAHKGDTDLILDGVTFTLRLDWNAIATLETRFAVDGVPRPIQEIVRSMSMSMLRDVLWVALQANHAREFPTPEKLGERMDLSDANRYAEAFKIAMTRALPKADPKADPKAVPTARPIMAGSEGTPATATTSTT